MSQFNQIKYKLITDQVAAIGNVISRTGHVTKDQGTQLNLLDIAWNNHIIEDGLDIKKLPIGGFKDGKITSLETFLEASDAHMEVRTHNLCTEMEKTFLSEIKIGKSSYTPLQKVEKISEILRLREEIMEQYQAIGSQPVNRVVSYECSLPVEDLESRVWENSALEAFVDVDKSGIYYPKSLESELFEHLDGYDDFKFKDVSIAPVAIPGLKNVEDYVVKIQRKKELEKEFSMGGKAP